MQAGLSRAPEIGSAASTLALRPFTGPWSAIATSPTGPRSFGHASGGKRSMMLIAALTLLVAGLALCIDRERSGDLYLQLFTGRFISAHGLAAADPFRTIAHSRPWLNQQWLSELSFYAAARAIGITGLTVLYAFLIAAPLAVVLTCIRRKGMAAMLAAGVFYFPGILAIVHPRAPLFT